MVFEHRMPRKIYGHSFMKYSVNTFCNEEAREVILTCLFC